MVQISATCTFQNGNNDTNTIRGNLAVISDGGFTFSQMSNWKGTSTPVKNVYFISGYTAAACTGTKNITVGNNTYFDAFTNVFFYTPCTANMNNTNNFNGQVLAANVTSRQPVHDDVPAGAHARPGKGDGFTRDIAYIREV